MTGLKMQMCKGREGGTIEDRTKRKVEKAGKRVRGGGTGRETVIPESDVELCSAVPQSALTS